MKMTTSIKALLINAVFCLYILLFTYAAVTKLLDFENFKQQLGQSPLLSAFANQVSWAVPVVELLIVLMLVVPKFRFTGLVAAFILMSMFTVYIYIILNHSVFVPCSCGGILEKLTWGEHLVFNICFVGLAAIAIGLNISESGCNSAKIVMSVSLLSLLGIGLLVILFVFSENITRYHNKFIRRLSKTPATKMHTTVLPFNSYYFAGIDPNTLYMGNTTSQLLLAELDLKSGSIKERHIILDKTDLPFRSVTIRVRQPYFYVFDGMVPCIFRGRLNDRKAHFYKSGSEYFSFAEPIDSLSIAVRTQRRGTGESILGKVRLLSEAPTLLNKRLLQKQIDGVFDTDGVLMYNYQLNRIIYLYAYRNEFIVAKDNLKLDFRGNTIDTVTHAQLDIASIENRQANKLARSPLLVNKAAAVYDNLLFVNAGLPGQYESLKMWKRASIIDVYDIPTNSYLESFYIYDINGKKVRNLIVHNDRLYAMIGNQIVHYKLNRILTKHYSKNRAALQPHNLLAK
jgi:methylamine utilization protein MauE